MDRKAAEKPTYEELEAENRALRALVQKLERVATALQKENRALVLRVEQLEKQLSEKQPPPNPPAPPPFVKPSKKGRKKKPGRRKGHPGASRFLAGHVDEEIELSLHVCPDCGGGLGGPNETRFHDQEDIVPAQVKVTRYVRRRYWCGACRKQVEAPPSGHEIPNARIGPLALAWAAQLNNAFALPFRKVALLFRDLCGLNVTAGALAQGAQRMAKWLGPEMDALREAIRGSPSVNVDETGWRIDGANGWLWVFATKHYVLYRAAHSRGSRIVIEELGETFNGVVVADFFSAYNKLTFGQQKCLVHLLRELREVAKKNASREYAAFRKKLKRLIGDALRLLKAHGSLLENNYESRLIRILDRARNLALADYADPDCRRLAKRLRRHEGEMFTFLFHPDEVDPENNRAERAIRPMVVRRKVSGGSRSQNGADATAAIMSLSQTCKLQTKDFIDYALNSIQHHRDGCQGTIFDATLLSES